LNWWDERYSEKGFAYGTEPNDFLVTVADQIPGKRVLSVAEGEGRNAVFLARRGFDVTAVDSSRVGLEKARQLAAEQGLQLETIVADLSTYDPGIDQWDAVVSIFCHLPAPVRKQLHKKIIAALKTGGILALEAYHPRQLEFATGGPQSAELMPTLDDLHSELEGLRFIIGHEIEREVIEGKYHFGQAAVIQVLAVKD